MAIQEPVKRITATITIEDLLAQFPSSVRYLIKKGLPCLTCGEPTWGTLEELARDRGFSEPAIQVLVSEMNDLLTRQELA